MLLQQAKAIPARRNALRKNSKKLPRRRDNRSYHTMVKIDKCPHGLSRGFSSIFTRSDFPSERDLLQRLQASLGMGVCLILYAAPYRSPHP